MTIIVLIILAGVSIAMLVGENGIITQAQRAKEETEQAERKEESNLNYVDKYMDGIINGNDMPILTMSEAKETEELVEKTIVIDEKNNEIIVPAGFKIAKDSGDTVQQGIVIEDVSASEDSNMQGSQYVWIPVGTFTKDDWSLSEEIKLGRYTFNTTNGIPNLEQEGTNYTNEIMVSLFYKELANYQKGIESTEVGVAENASAKNLKNFIESVSVNGGYYIGRYEASYASGAINTTTIDDYEKYKAASKVSKTVFSASSSYNTETLWNNITQLNASKVAINTYADTDGITSDLMNSYAWDTAIVYIQEVGNSNYANKRGTEINTNLTNTGINGDEVCKINDMASNLREWTTENSNYTRQRTCTSMHRQRRKFL